MTNVLQSLHVLTDTVMPVTNIKPNKYNPNRQSDDEFLMLCNSIREDGFTDAVLVNTDMSIIDGEHRWTAAIVVHHLLSTGQTISLSSTRAARLKRQEIMDPNLMIPVKILDKDEIQRRISTQRHNKARGHDDIELAAQMFRELEAMGGLDDAIKGLDMTDEEVSRLLSYGDSILDHFPGDEPSVAWEPRQTLPGQVESWVDTASNQRQSVTRAAATPVPVVLPEPVVPGMAVDAYKSIPAAVRPEPMARRMFVMTESEAAVVDKALGKNAAQTLVRLCEEKLHRDQSNGSEEQQSVP